MHKEQRQASRERVHVRWRAVDQLIPTLGADGFTVGNDVRVNRDGTTYHYVAWNQIPGKMDVGTYTGNGADNRNIAGVGFQPDFLMVQTDDGLPTGCALDGDGAIDRHLALLQRDRQPGQPDSRAPARRFPGRLGAGGRMKRHGPFTYAAWGRAAPTAVRMASMSARRTEKGVVLEWRTGYEVDNLGFHVYRGPENGRVRLTTSLLAGSGLQQSSGIETGASHSYRWSDETAGARAARRRVLGGGNRAERNGHGTARSDRRVRSRAVVPWRASREGVQTLLHRLRPPQPDRRHSGKQPGLPFLPRTKVACQREARRVLAPSHPWHRRTHFKASGRLPRRPP